MFLRNTLTRTGSHINLSCKDACLASGIEDPTVTFFYLNMYFPPRSVPNSTHTVHLMCKVATEVLNRLPARTTPILSMDANTEFSIHREAYGSQIVEANCVGECNLGVENSNAPLLGKCWMDVTSSWSQPSKSFPNFHIRFTQDTTTHRPCCNPIICASEQPVL